MRKLLFLLLLVSGIASAQYTPTGSKTRFINGIGLGTKSDAAFGTVDSLVLYAKADSTLNFKFKGTARALAYANQLANYVLYTDTSGMLSPYQRSYNAVTIAGTQTITGAKTFTNSTVQINTLTFGQGTGIDSQIIAKYPGNGEVIYRETAAYPYVYGFNIPTSGGGNQNSFFEVFDEGSEKQVYYKGDGASGNNIWGVGSRATADTGWKALFVINQNGNTGIMKNNPSYPLDVVGTGRFTNIRMDQDILADNDLGYGWKGTDGTRFISYTSGGGTILGSTGSVKTVIQGNGGRVVIGTTSDDATNTLQITGTVYNSVLGTGTVYSNSGVLTSTNPSDSTLKDSIMPMRYGLAEILKLKPKTFYYKSDSAHTVKYGFIAQDVKPIMPDVVRKLDPKKEDSKLGLETDGIYVTLVKAIQEQQAIIDDLKKRIIALENK